MIRRVFVHLVVAGALILASEAQTPSTVMGATHEVLYSITSDPGAGYFRVYPSGDLDLDGWEDLVLSEPLFNLGAGRIRAYSGASGVLMWETFGTQSIGSTGLPPSEVMGDAVAILDWDGDGLLDVAGSAPQFCVGAPCPGPISGRIRIMRGYDGFLLTEILPPGSVQALSVGGVLQGFGASLGTGGDLTGDGVPDLVAATTGFYPSPGVNAGVAIAIAASSGQVVAAIPGTHHFEAFGSWDPVSEFGGVQILPGVGSSPSGQIVVASPATDFGTANWAGSLRVYWSSGGSPLFQLLGTQACGRLGWRLVGDRDVTGDSYPDFAILRWPFPPGPGCFCCPSSPRIDVFSGATLQLAATQYLYPGAFGNPYQCVRIDLIPDVSGDGQADILACMWSLSPPTSNMSHTQLYQGTPGNPITGNPIIGWTITDPLAGYGYGPWEGRGIGDVNNDGWGDIGMLHNAGGSQVSVTASVLEVFAKRNFAATGNIAPGGQATFAIATPRHPSRPFLLLFSAAPGPPVQAGPYVIPLAGDALFTASLNLGLVGALDASGNGTLLLPIPNDPTLSGATVYASGVVVDPTSVYGIGTILTRLTLTVL